MKQKEVLMGYMKYVYSLYKNPQSDYDNKLNISK